MRFLLSIFTCVVAAYGLGFYLTVPANPEVRFWREVVISRQADIHTARHSNPNTPFVFFTGGSSTAFSIDPLIIEKTCGIPAFNLGLPVSAGDKYLLHQAMEQTKQGDILVICLEPDLLTYPNQETAATTLSFSLSSAAGKPSDAAGGATFGQSTSIREYLNLSRPGPSYLVTLIAKTITGKGYRYSREDLRYHGRVETQVTDPTMTPRDSGTATRLTSQGRHLLTTFKSAADKRGIRVCYAMPWVLTAKDSIKQSRGNNRKINEDIRSIMPVIDDGFLGAVSDPAWFSDSPQHLTEVGSKARSLALAPQIRIWLASSH